MSWATKVAATVKWLRNDKKCKQKTRLQPKYQYLSTQNYLQGLSKSCCAFITDIVPLQVDCLEGLVYLQEINRKDTVSGC